MKKSVYAFIMCCLFTASYASTNEFSYDKDDLAKDFEQVDKVSQFLETTPATYEEITSNPVFSGNVELTKHIGLRPTFTLDDMDWGSFAWGFCCWPVGFFVVAINRDKSKEEKTSFWIGMAVSTILGIISNVALLAAGA